MNRELTTDGTDAVPTKRFTFNPITGEHESRTPTEKFIKGPISLAWISLANSLPGKAGAVAIAIWFLAGVNKSKTVKLTGEIERIAGCKRKALYAALNALEMDRLISVLRIPGARPVVTLLACQPRNESPSTGSH
jgi:hypothetical protein